MKKKTFLTVLALLCVIGLVGCNTTPNEKDLSPQDETSGLRDSDHNRDETPEDYPPSVMVNGVVYQDTGYVNSMVTCGTMDGKITSSVDGSELPTEDDQSNFGTGYGYQLNEEDQIVVEIEGQPFIFIRMDSKEESIPSQVLNFKAKVKEVKDGFILVTHIDTAEGFQEMMSGDYIVPTMNTTDEIAVGDTVRIWIDGTVKESDPYQLNQVYRIEKE